jgi:sugar lactone lactonase YvrE
MKQKRYIITGLLLLLVIVFFISKDLFFPKGDDNKNPYEYNLDDLKKSDSLVVAFKEIKQFAPGLDEIYGIAVDLSDRIYISGTNGFEIFDNSGKIEKRIPVEGIARSIHVDKTGKIFLGMEDHIEVFDDTGKRIGKWKSEGKNSILTSIAATSADVFVADAGEKVVYHYDLNGKLINRIGEKDPQNNIPGFVIPSPYFDIGISHSGQLWVVDPGRHTLMNFSFDGNRISSWGKASMGVDGFCGCCNPSNFAFLSDGSFITCEKGIERIKVYEPDGTYKYLVATPGSFEEGTRGMDLAVDSQDRILVLDPVKKKVRFFVKK